MCGIAGVIRIHEPGQAPHPLEAIPEAWLDVLDEGIKHRGPDGQGRFRDRATRPDGTIVDVAFVHRRLSILDHAGGHQPMVHDGERLRPDLTYQPGEEPKLAHELCPGKPLVAVVFNGCIYNQHELRTELTQQGAWFETDHSDTEVLVHGWRRWGMYMQEELDGMYAAMLWDRASGQVADASDLGGQKPLYSNKRGNTWFRTSAIGPLVSHRLGLVDHPQIYLPGFERWVAAGSDRTPAVPAFNHGTGDWLILPAQPQKGSMPGGPSQKMASRSRRLPERNEPGRRFHHYREPRLVTHLPELLQKSVRSHLESDVPLGVFLSGGIDSGLIAAIANQEIGDLKTFTVRMPDPRIDESEAAAETARVLGARHTTLDCSPDPAIDLVNLIHQLGLPFGDSSLLPTYWLCKEVRPHVKVALSGDGGDELFGGYRRHTIAPVLNRWHKLLRLIPHRLLDQCSPGSRGEYLSRLAIAAKHGGYAELLAIFQTPDLRRLIPSIDGECPGTDTFERVDDPLRHDFQHYLPDDLLRKTDTASMAVALEVRAPFLARELVEAALRTPLHILMPNNERKGLLKQVARKYLPDHIVDRPKQGFAIPIGQWFRDDYGGLRQLLYDHLESADPFPGLAGAGVEINMGFVRQMLREHDAAGEKSLNPWHGRDHSQRLYMLLVLSIWAKWLAALPRDGPQQ
jgi:asparagine synthase (glutamine-hydrolysing)